MTITDKLFYQGITFYLTSTANHERIYTSLDELHEYHIITPISDYDGALVATVDESFREDDEDDMIRYFDCVTGIEESYN